MSDSFTLRYANKADAAAITRLELWSAQHEARVYPLPPYPELCAIWRNRLEQQTHVVILAQTDAELIGFAAIARPVKKGFLLALYIAPHFFRRGVGSTLLQYAERLVRAEGGRQLFLEVEERNLRAQAFYRAKQYLPQAQYVDGHLIPYRKRW